MKPLSDLELNLLRTRIIGARVNKQAWPELSLQIQTYHESQQSLIGKSKIGRPGEGNKKGWSVRDSAKALGLSLGGLSEYLNLARLIKDRPEMVEFSYERALEILRKR